MARLGRNIHRCCADAQEGVYGGAQIVALGRHCDRHFWSAVLPCSQLVSYPSVFVVLWTGPFGLVGVEPTLTLAKSQGVRRMRKMLKGQDPEKYWRRNTREKPTRATKKKVAKTITVCGSRIKQIEKFVQNREKKQETFRRLVPTRFRVCCTDASQSNLHSHKMVTI